MQEGTDATTRPMGARIRASGKTACRTGKVNTAAPDGKTFSGEWVDGVFQSGSPDEQDQEDAPDPNKV